MSALARYAIGLRAYLRQPLPGEECRRRLARQLAARDRWLLRILERAVYANPASPYRRLLENASVELGDVARMVEEEGVEGALGRLHDAGVHITLDEFKGRRPICRPGLELRVGDHDFDNPLLRRDYEARTSGSHGPGTRIHIDLDLLAHEAAYHHLFLRAFGLEDRGHALWRPVPPGHAGLKSLLRHAKLGRRTERWFAHNARPLRLADLKFTAFTAYTVLGSRLAGVPLPAPEHVPMTQARRIGGWLAGAAASGAPVLFETNWSSAVRVCDAARQEGLDIAGTFFRLGGEPGTAARVHAITSTGSHLASHYSMGEVGHIGIACAAPGSAGEVHVMTDKQALIERPAMARNGETISSLHLTTLHPSCPKMMLNVDTGDYGVLERRRCGCPVDAMGFDTHLRGIASYDKLTSEGMNLLGSDVMRLVDEVLPESFGGVPTDYQLVEEEVDALPRLIVVVSPAIGAVDEREVIETVLGALSAIGRPQRMMADQWRHGHTLRVQRRPPYTVRGAKVPLLHRIAPPG